MFYRTIRMLESGMKPIYVFDGAPPEAKRDELSRRAGARGDAAADLAEAKEAGADEEAVAKLAKRTVKVTKVHNEECKRLLRLLWDRSGASLARWLAVLKAEEIWNDEEALTHLAAKQSQALELRLTSVMEQWSLMQAGVAEGDKAV